MQVTITVVTDGLDLTEDQVRAAVQSGTVMALNLRLAAPLYKDTTLSQDDRRAKTKIIYQDVKSRVMLD